MKSPTAYYLMLLYLTVVLKPLLPIACDWWAHEFDGMEHIATVHAKYGSHHLQKEIADTGSENSHESGRNTANFEDSFPVHLTTQQSISYQDLEKSSNQYSIFAVNKLPFSFSLY